VDAHLVGKNLT